MARAFDFTSHKSVNAPGWQVIDEHPAGSTHFHIFFPLEKAKAFHSFPDTVTGTEVPSLGKKPGDEGRERAGRGAE